MIRCHVFATTWNARTFLYGVEFVLGMRQRIYRFRNPLQLAPPGTSAGKEPPQKSVLALKREIPNGGTGGGGGATSSFSSQPAFTTLLANLVIPPPIEWWRDVAFRGRRL